VNLFLAFFNMVPAFPMDGGRVLRAMLAIWLKYERATTIAARVGQVIAFLMIIYGVMQVNVRIPANAPSGPQPIVIQLSNSGSSTTFKTQTGITVAVQ